MSVVEMFFCYLKADTIWIAERENGGMKDEQVLFIIIGNFACGRCIGWLRQRTEKRFSRYP
jgi:hypothetical protein